MTAAPAPIRRVWGVLSSVWVGLFLLLNLAGLALFITVRYQGPEPYFLSPLYLTLLGAFGVNIGCVLADRYRFRLTQLGFLMTHIGILTCLAGGAMTHWSGEDGQVQIREGETSSSFLVDRTAGLYQARQLEAVTSQGRGEIRFDVAPPARLPAATLAGLEVRLLEHLPHALRVRTAEAAQGFPPALRFRVGMNVASVEDWLQADDPALGMREVGNGLVARYLSVPTEPAGIAVPDIKALTFLEGPGGSLGFWEANGKGGRVFHSLAVGQAAACTLSPLKVSVLERMPSAAVLEGFTASARGEEEALRLMVSHGGASRALWASWGESVHLEVGGLAAFLRFGSPKRDLGFSLSLEDFRKEDYEGSAIPRSFESLGTLDDPGAGLARRPFHIRMNEPLIHRGWTFFQAAFSPASAPGGKEATVLQVSRDPGKTVVYTGALLVVSGVVFMFYLKPWMGRKGLL